MRQKQTSKQVRVARQAMQIAALAPAVASARLARVVATGNVAAFNRMGVEKASVFTAATAGMMFAGAAALAKSSLVLANAWSPWGGTARQRMERVNATWVDLWTDVANGTLKPIRKRVVANSKRPGR